MALTATDWTATTQHTRIQNGERRNLVKLTLPTDGLYPSNGIPVNSTNCRMIRNVDHIIIVDPDATAYVPKYDKDNSSIRIFSLASTGGAELATTATVGSTVLGTIYIEAIGW